jgi:molybdenum cofactor cytidylyltransferase
MDGCAILLPAAGASARMRGRDKLLEQVAGRPLLHVMAARACQVSAHVAVTLRATDAARHTAVTGLALRPIPITDAAEGMAASLRAGVHWAMPGPCRALMIVLPDMPDITSDDLRALMAEAALFPDRPLRAASVDLRPGHPVVFPRHIWPALARVRGDTGARDVLVNHPPRLFPLLGQRALADLDTPEDWARWRGQPN